MTQHNFEYEAIREDGTHVQGETSAEGIEQVIEWLKSQGLTVIRIAIRPEPEPPSAEKAPPVGLTEALSLDMSALSEQMHRELRAQSEIIQGMESFAAELPPSRLKRQITRLVKAITAAPHTSLKPRPSVFVQMCSVLADCRSGYSTPAIVERLIDHAKQEDEQTRSMLKKLRYPVTLCLIAAVAMFLWMVFSKDLVVSPETFLFSMNQAETRTAAGFVSTAREGLFAIVALWVVILSVIYVVPRVLPSVILDRVPLMGRIWRGAAKSDFLRCLAGLVALDISPHEAVQAAGAMSSRSGLRRAVRRWTGGKAASAKQDHALTDPTGEIPAAALLAIQPNRTTAQRLSLLSELADDQTARCRESWRRLSVLAEPLVILLIGFIVFRNLTIFFGFLSRLF